MNKYAARLLPASLLACGCLLATTYPGFLPAEENPAAATPISSPLTIADSLANFQLHPDLKIEIAAAEPGVIDPVAIRFDEQGRMWVVEMRDYPNGPGEGEPPRSRISVLEDRDGDGRFETSQVFADNLLFATGIQPWQGGVIATVAGEVIYLKDTNGDGVADLRETWFSGFVAENPQLRANHPTLALDNHVYVANGLRGGSVVTEREQWDGDAKPVSISGMDFRFDPLAGNPEGVSGVGQFGLSFDDFGNRFTCSNRNPCIHIVLADRYIKRNPFLAVGAVVNDVSPAGTISRVYPISNFWTTSTLHEGQFTAACGVTIYRGDALPAAFRGNSFTCEPTGNLVHRDVLTPSGATFASTPGRDKVEFLASPDTWFRPVNLTVGPDGALYVVDMYRAVIEHPQWMPEELRDRTDLEYGNDRGRIWRITPKNWKRPTEQPQLASATSEKLVEYLTRDNAWWRETAQRLLIERQAREVQPQLEQLVGGDAKPTAAVHALWTLNGLGVLSDDVIATGLAHSSPRVREQAVRLSESRQSKSQSLQAAVMNLADDDDPRVRFQTALSLGEASANEEQLTALADALAVGGADPWTRLAVFSAAPNLEQELLRRLWTKPVAPEKLAPLATEIAALVGSRQKPEEIGGVLQNLATLPVAMLDAAKMQLQAALISGLGQGLGRRGVKLDGMLNKLPAEFADTRTAVQNVFEQAKSTAANTKQDPAARTAAIQLLQYTTFADAGSTLMELIENDPAQGIRLAGIDVLAGFHDESIGPFLLTGFSGQTPAGRRAVINALLRNDARATLLLDEIEAQTIAVAELGATNVNRLTQHKNPELKTRAGQLLASAIPADRKEVLAKYQAALTLKPDPQQGRALFEKNCSTCHRVSNIGVEIGPDIADSRTRQPAALLTDILNPNRAIDANYVSYSIVTEQGTTVTGIIAAETASSITIKQPEGKHVTVLRQDIDEVISNGISLMPEGLEKNLNLQQMADLIAFIKNWRYLDGNVPLRER